MPKHTLLADSDEEEVTVKKVNGKKKNAGSTSKKIERSSDNSSSSSDSESNVKVDEAAKKRVIPQEKDKKGKGKGKGKANEEIETVKKQKRNEEESAKDQIAQPDKKRSKEHHTNGNVGTSGSSMSKIDVENWRKHNDITVAELDREANTVGSNDCAPFSQFSDAGFPDYIQKSIEQFNFSTPTPIQAQAWSLALQGRDIVGIAETGSGKTLAFVYPAIIHMKKNANTRPGPKVLVLAPTRELAQQIYDVAAQACRPANYSACCVYGGTPKGPQQLQIKSADVVVATPGRLIDLIEDGSAKLGQVEFMVFDEADRMLEMGFMPQIRRIVAEVPEKRQTLMFSATWPIDVQKFAQTYLRNPVQITIGGENLTGAKQVTQIVQVCTHEGEKIPKLKALLKQLMANQSNPKILVFMLYKHTCDSLTTKLQSEKWNADSLHGGKSQGARERAIANFRDGTCPILIATDVASRGLDIKDVKYVINVEMPLVMEDYIHRIGRTGRAGEEGKAYTLFAPEDKVHARQLVRILEDSSQEVPAGLAKIAETAPVTKPRKTAMEHLYGDFAKGMDAQMMSKKPTIITFDS